MTTTVLQRPTLILNRNWQPVNVASVARALVLVARGNARVVDPHDYQLYTWEDWTQLVPGRDEPHEARCAFLPAGDGDHAVRDPRAQGGEGGIAHRAPRLSGPDKVDPAEGRKGNRRPDLGRLEKDGFAVQAQGRSHHPRRIDRFQRGTEEPHQPILLRGVHGPRQIDLRQANRRSSQRESSVKAKHMMK